MHLIKRWWLKEAEWWQGWLPQSGATGAGLMFGGTLIVIGVIQCI